MKVYLLLTIAAQSIVQVTSKTVFAHFMLGNTETYTPSQWESEMRLARDSKIDGFALNMAYFEPTNNQSLAWAFQAAASIGNTVKLFFSFDYAGGTAGPWPQSEVIRMINQYKNHTSYFRHHGEKPLVSTFEGPDNAADWHLIKSITGCFFMPSWSSLGAQKAANKENGVVDGLFSWAAWPTGPNDMYNVVDASYFEFLPSGKPYMMPVSPWFYTNMPGFLKNWLWRGDDLWFDRWQQINYLQPEYVQIISWNDYGESHYIGPLQSNGYVAFGENFGKSPYNYALDMPHDGWRLFLPFMIEMYKNNISSVTQEGLVTWYRKHPSSSCTTGGTTGNTATQLQQQFDPGTIAQDRVFFTALLASSATVTVTIGGVSQTVQNWRHTPEGGIGLYHGSLPFNGNTGAVTVTLSRGSSQIARVTGKDITTNCEKNIQNYNPWVGSARAANPIPAATPAKTLGQQVCIKGRGLGTYLGLCDYGCKYGYCPKGQCSCVAMGTQRTLPKWSGYSGCPAPGYDRTHTGLCSFGCGLDYCSVSACRQVPDKTVCNAPAAVDPPVPVCVAGTAFNILKELCEFACRFGKCPPASCMCTLAGAAFEQSPQLVGAAGSPRAEALPDNGLCEYSCARGFCPSNACTSSGGTGAAFIDPSIWSAASPVVQCQPPCVLVMPPKPLGSTTTVSFPLYTTTFTQYLPYTETVTIGEGKSTTIEGVDQRTIVTVITIPPVKTTVIDVWRVVITTSQTSFNIVLTSSIQPPPMTITLQSSSSKVVTTEWTPPPYPYSQTTKDTILNTKSTSFRVGPILPLCTSGPSCGRECLAFCNRPCLFCKPWGGGVFPPGGGSPGNNDDCVSVTKSACQTGCVGSSCSTSCSSTVGCSPTAEGGYYAATPAPAYLYDYKPGSFDLDGEQQAPLDAMATSMVSYISKVLELQPQPTQPPSGSYELVIAWYSWPGQVAGFSQWAFYVLPRNSESYNICYDYTSRIDAPSNIIPGSVPFPDGEFRLEYPVHGMTGCKYRGSSASPGTFTCDGSQQIDCYVDDYNGQSFPCFEQESLSTRWPKMVPLSADFKGARAHNGTHWDDGQLRQSGFMANSTVVAAQRNSTASP